MKRFGLSGKKKKSNKNADQQAPTYVSNEGMTSNIQMSSISRENVVNESVVNDSVVNDSVVRENDSAIVDLEKNDGNLLQVNSEARFPAASRYDPPNLPSSASLDSTIVTDKMEDRYNIDPALQGTSNGTLVTATIATAPIPTTANAETSPRKTIRNAMSQDSALGWSTAGSKSCEEDTYYTLDEDESYATSAKGRSTTYTYNTHDDDYYYVKQKIAFFSILISTLQLGILTVMMALCGVAPFDVNPMIGPYPDTLSMWGGKNIYGLLTSNQFYRILSPVALHTGVIHLFCNLAIQLETGAFFEREWGSARWITIYISSAAGAMLSNYIFNPDTISVGSSGPIMGLFGAKLSEILSLSLFETMRHERDFGDFVRMEQFGGLFCSSLVVSAFAFIPYVEWSGHMGGLITGFLIGMVIFSRYIKNLGLIFFWGGLGFFGLFFLGVWGTRFLLEETEIDNDLADPCTMYSGLHADGYSCQCY